MNRVTDILSREAAAGFELVDDFDNPDFEEIDRRIDWVVDRVLADVGTVTVDSDR